MLVYVTGISGSGKSAVCAELLARGYAAKDSDLGISGWFRRADGDEVPTPPGDDFRTPEWYRLHEWRFSLERATQLAKQVEGRLGFLCGHAAGDAEIWHLFERVFLLHVDEATLRERLRTRTSNSYGKAPHELEQILSQHARFDDAYRRFGAHPLDGARPAREVVDELLANLERARLPQADTA